VRKGSFDSLSVRTNIPLQQALSRNEREKMKHLLNSNISNTKPMAILSNLHIKTAETFNVYLFLDAYFISRLIDLILKPL
jgi:hypothetical protein